MIDDPSYMTMGSGAGCIQTAASVAVTGESWVEGWNVLYGWQSNVDKHLG